MLDQPLSFGEDPGGAHLVQSSIHLETARPECQRDCGKRDLRDEGTYPSRSSYGMDMIYATSEPIPNLGEGVGHTFVIMPLHVTS